MNESVNNKFGWSLGLREELEYPGSTRLINLNKCLILIVSNQKIGDDNTPCVFC